MSGHVVGLVVPEATDTVPAEAAAMYPDLTFIAHGIGLQSLSVTGYDEAICRVVPAARSLAERGARAIMVVGTSLTFYRGAAFNHALTDDILSTTGLPSATMSGALVDGLEEVRARKVAVVTAYSDQVNGMLAAFLRQSGFDVLSLRSVSIVQRVGEAARVNEGDIFDASVAAHERRRLRRWASDRLRRASHPRRYAPHRGVLRDTRRIEHARGSSPGSTSCRRYRTARGRVRPLAQRRKAPSSGMTAVTETSIRSKRI